MTTKTTFPSKKTGRKPTYNTLIDRVMANTIILPWSGCWIYMGSTNSRGHGMISVYRGRVFRRKVLGVPQTVKYLRETLSVHRTLYKIIFNKDLPDSTVLRHFYCDIPCCWNPDHLKEGSQADNINDQIVRGTNINQKRWYHKRQEETSKYLVGRILDSGF